MSLLIIVQVESVKTKGKMPHKKVHTKLVNLYNVTTTRETVVHYGTSYQHYTPEILIKKVQDEKYIKIVGQ